MANPDITRSEFDREKHYDSVIMQQGRVILDDDWNENEAIRLEDQRRHLVDVIGPVGSPDKGFQIKNAAITNNIKNTKEINFDIVEGTFYLSGLRLELENKQTYRTQTDWLQGPDDVSDPQQTVPKDDRWDLVYLEAFQQPVGAVEDNELFEVALGGPDTSMRMRTVQRVHLVNIPHQTANCAQYWQKLLEKWVGENKGTVKTHELVADTTLTVSYIANQTTSNLCKPAFRGGYLGAENQAIRVQLVDTNNFTWGFDNGSALYRVTIEKDNKTITFLTEPKDPEHWPQKGQTVEILPWAAVLPNGEKLAEMQGHLSLVNKSCARNASDKLELTLATPLQPNFGQAWNSRDDSSSLQQDRKTQQIDIYYYLRVWDRGSDRSSQASISFTATQPVTLSNTGLKVTFEGKSFKPGDYWIIAARPDTPNQVVPWKLEKNCSAHGVQHFYAPLALIHWKNEKAIEIKDCRPKFIPLTKLRTCCTYRVGDGKNSFGDFDSIQDAVDNLPSTGGEICILPGNHSANVEISGKSNIIIKGCGRQSQISPTSTNSQSPIFSIVDSQSIKLEQMELITEEGTAIALTAKNSKKLQEISIGYNRIIACTHAISVTHDTSTSEGSHIHIHNNKIGMFDFDKGDVAILLDADDCLLERNEIAIEPVPNAPNSFQAMGGIQIACGSERVKIIRNQIRGGWGNGITLGGGSAPNDNEPASICDIEIENNEISEMGLSGIGTSLLTQVILNPLDNNYNLAQNFGALSEIAIKINIQNNHIFHCLQKNFDSNNTRITELLKQRGEGGISLGLCENLRIFNNIIEENGQIILDPVCGIFISCASQVEISHNHILNNGTDANGNLIPGIRGGVVLRLVTSIEVFPKLDMGGYAARIHDNIIRQPVGQSLCMAALGPISILNNQFNTDSANFPNGTVPHLGWIDLSAGTVLVINLGGFTFRKLGVAPSPWLKGNVLFSNNQTRLGSANSSLSSQSLATLDDLGFHNNQSEVLAVSSKIFQVNTSLLARTLRATNNSLQEQLIPIMNQSRSEDREKVRVLSLLTVSSQFNITSLNQGDHCTIAVCGKNGELESSSNQPKVACSECNFNNFGESSWPKEILRAIVNDIWFGTQILPKP